MTHDLSAPLRVAWTVPDDAETAGRMLERLIEGRVLFIEAELTKMSAVPLAQALGKLEKVAARLTLIGNVEALKAFAGSHSETGNMEALLLLEGGETPESAAFVTGRFSQSSLGLWSTPVSLENFPTALALAADMGLQLSILNPHAPAVHLDSELRSSLAAIWNKVATKPRAVVHDLFLAEALGLDPFNHYKGCAAAGALAYLDATGKLKACRTLPLPLGDLATTSLKTIWRGELRRGFLTVFQSAPDACDDCALALRCRGGCPGLAGKDGRDRSCTETRKG